jgi:hypothetical protein
MTSPFQMTRRVDEPPEKPAISGASRSTDKFSRRVAPEVNSARYSNLAEGGIDRNYKATEC